MTDDLLAPGWTPYRKRMLAETYDVTDLLGVGENVIGAVLGDGWYRGRLGWESETARNRYGDRLGLLAQLEMTLEDGTTSIIATDGVVAGVDRRDPLRRPVRRLRHRPPPGAGRLGSPGVRRTRLAPGRAVPFDRSRLEPRVAPPVRVIATLPCAIDAAARTVVAGGSMRARTWPAGSGCASAGRSAAP